jgi:hypothetical protein
MRKVYEFAGGRKMFAFYITITLLFTGGYLMEDQQYRTFETGLFMLTAMLVVGNVSSKLVESRTKILTNNNSQNENS